MAYPIAPTISYSYTGFAQSLGDGSFPGTQLDADLANLASFNASLASFLPLFVNSDGSLKTSALIGDAALSGAVAEAETAASQAAASAVLADAARTGAAASAASAASTLSSAMLKSANLSDVASVVTARNNLGLGSFATKSSLVLADVSSGFFTADATGRGKFASGFVDNTLLAAGAVVQVVRSETAAVTTGTTLIPGDDTIPQSTEGTALAALDTTITPRSATNRLIVDVLLFASPSAVATVAAALFKDSETGARATTWASVTNLGAGVLALRFEMVAGSTAATTFRLRYGPTGAATVTINGSGGARFFGGVLLSYMQITEVKA